MSERSVEQIRQDWMGRLGRPVSLDFPFFAVDEAWPVEPGRTIVAGELGTGSVRAGDVLEAAGITPLRTAVRVLRVERPIPQRRDVEVVETGSAGEVLGILVEHDPTREVVAGQCLAPVGALQTAARVSGEVWLVTAEDLPGTAEEHRTLLDDVAANRGIEVFFHTRSVPGRVVGSWTPVLGAEFSATFQLDAPVALYPGTRFALRYRALTFGVGFVRQEKQSG